MDRNKEQNRSGYAPEPEEEIYIEDLEEEDFFDGEDEEEDFFDGQDEEEEDFFDGQDGNEKNAITTGKTDGAAKDRRQSVKNRRRSAKDYLKSAKERRNFQVRLNRMRLITAAAVLLMLVFAGLFFWQIIKNKNIGANIEPLKVLSEEMDLEGPEGMEELVTGTYVRYLKKAYVLFGNYPDCSYYKVASGIARNDYDFEQDFYTGEGESYRNYYKNGEKLGRVAIDVSTYQKDVNWDQVKASGVEVVIVRTGFRGYGEDGKLVEDNQFRENMEGALNAGLDCGAYFFTEAVSYEEGVEEARYILEQVKGYSLTEPIIVDTEKIGKEGVRANDLDVETRTQALLGFCETIEAAGYTPMVYASTAWFCQAMDMSKIGKYELWLAAYDTPQFPYHVEGWQYDPHGSVPGIEGDVDMNVWLR